jgi:hypothetical protein
MPVEPHPSYGAVLLAERPVNLSDRGHWGDFQTATNPAVAKGPGGQPPAVTEFRAGQLTMALLSFP